jgi:hypothetical protein
MLLRAARQQGVTDEVLIAVLQELIEALRQGAELGKATTVVGSFHQRCSLMYSVDGIYRRCPRASVAASAGRCRHLRCCDRGLFS